jgi:hypothetical protein
MNLSDVDLLESNYEIAKKALCKVQYIGGDPTYPDDIEEFFKALICGPCCDGTYYPKQSLEILNDIGKADISEISSLMMSANRSRRFGDGAWVSILEKDQLKPIFTRLRELVSV